MTKIYRGYFREQNGVFSQNLQGVFSKFFGQGVYQNTNPTPWGFPGGGGTGVPLYLTFKSSISLKVLKTHKDSYFH